MPASELQLKLLRENKRCIELAGTMTQVVYPKLIYLLEQLGQEQVCFSSIKTYKNFYFDLNKGLNQVIKICYYYIIFMHLLILNFYFRP